MMLTGGSKVCCVDEVSGGLDPLSRRKVWDILLAERCNRTIILTTHFLDEAEFLADHMVIMSKGTLKAEGSVSELKNKLGGGYRIHTLHGTGYGPPPETIDLLGDVPKEVMYDQTIYTVSDTGRAMKVIKEFENQGITKYQVTGPTIEEVFMKLAEDSDSEKASEISDSVSDNVITPAPSHHREKATATITQKHGGEPLLSGKKIGFVQQALILFQKRMIILRRNYIPYVAAFLIPVVAAALLSILIKNYHYPGCSPAQQVNTQDLETLPTNSDYKPLLVVGPTSALLKADLTKLQGLLPQKFGDTNSSQSAISQYIYLVDTMDEYNAFIHQNYANVTPGGFFLGGNGTTPTFSYYSNVGYLGVYSSIFMQNAFDVLLTNISITTQLRLVFRFLQQQQSSLNMPSPFVMILSQAFTHIIIAPSTTHGQQIREMLYNLSSTSV